MGCDIHIHVERKNGDGWEHVMDDNWPDDVGYDDYKNTPAYILSGRNYALFSVLADVRNYDGIRPIAEPRGVPDDATKETKDHAGSWEGDGHSYSWALLRELMDYDWSQDVTVTGFVGLEGYREFKANGRPSSFCRGVGGGSIIHVSNEDMDRYLVKPPVDATPYTEISWCVPVSSRAHQAPFIDVLKNIGGPDEVRIVFWFDN